MAVSLKQKAMLELIYEAIQTLDPEDREKTVKAACILAGVDIKTDKK